MKARTEAQSQNGWGRPPAGKHTPKPDRTAPVPGTPLSTSYIALDKAGAPVATSAAFESLLRTARSLTAACVIIGAPSGTILSHVVHGASPGTHRGEAAARIWRLAHGIRPPPSAAEARADDVLRLRAEGLTLPQVAARLGISRTSVALALRAARADETPASMANNIDGSETSNGAGPRAARRRGHAIDSRAVSSASASTRGVIDNPQIVQRVIDMRRRGIARAIIASELGLGIRSVGKVIGAARKAGEQIPGPTQRARNPERAGKRGARRAGRRSRRDREEHAA